MSINLAVFVSGRGSNLAAILQAIEEGKLKATVKAVISNKEGIPALDIARKYNVQSYVIPHVGLRREEHEAKIYDKLEALSIDYVVLAGYMRLLSPYLLNKFRNKDGLSRILNIHPSLLPAFPGMTAYEDAFAYGVKMSGVTVFLVDEKVDHGAILAQECFPRLHNDSLEDFKKRGLALEHRLYPEVLQQLSESKHLIYKSERLLNQLK